MGFLKAYSKFLDILTMILKVLLTAMVVAMVIIMGYQVIMRYVFSNSKTWCEELTVYLGIYTILLGLGIASRRKGHLQVDFFYNMFSPKFKCLMECIFEIITVVVMVVVCKYSLSVIAHAMAKSSTLPFTMKQLYSIWPAASIVLILFSLEIAIKDLIGFLHNGQVPEIGGDKS